MGQITIPSSSGFPKIVSIDRLKASNAGAGQSGNHVFMTGAGAGQNSTGSDLVFLGENAGRSSTVNSMVLIGSQAGGNLGGGMRFADNAGATVVGSNSLSSIAFAGAPGPPIVFGSFNLSLIGRADNCVVIGYKIAQNMVGGGIGDAEMQNNVIIGHSILTGLGTAGAASCTNNVIIGHVASQGTAAVSMLQGCVIIGDGANFSIDTGLTDSVIIGSQAGTGVGTGILCFQNVYVGALTGQTATGPQVQQNTVMGYNADSGANTKNTVIGSQARVVGGSRSTVIGANAGLVATINNDCIVIGHLADTGEAALTSKLVIGATDVGGIMRSMVFGDLTNGNIVLGGSLTGVNRDLPGTNILKLLNGTQTGNPVGGGFFYVVGGILHWKASSGADSTLSPIAGQLAANVLTAYTNNAAAQAATLLNGPLAGNPTKWIPINDNGTIRNVPAW